MKTAVPRPLVVLAKLALASTRHHRRDEAIDDLLELHRDIAATRGGAAAHRRFLDELTRLCFWALIRHRPGGARPVASPLSSGPAPRENPTMHVFTDLRFAIRALRRQPLFTSAALLTLALGIGGVVAVFSVVNGVLLAPLSFAAPDDVIAITGLFQGDQRYPVSIPGYWRIHNEVDALESVAAVRGQRAVLSDRGMDPEHIDVGLITENYFDVLGFGVHLGAPLTRELDDGILLSYELWERRYGADPSIVGRTVQFDGSALPVAGVLPPGANPNPMTTRLTRRTYRAWRLLPESWIADDGDWEIMTLVLVGRRAQGVELRTLQAQLDAVALRVQAEVSDREDMTWHAAFFIDEYVGASRPAIRALVGAVSFVMLIACFNVANLFLARGQGRTGELALRAAVGASAARLRQLLLLESLVLATAQRQLLETYLARYREATSRSGENAAPADARVISQAVEPTEVSFPKVLPITIVAAFAAFLVSCVIIMLSELFSGRALRPVGRREDEVFDEEPVEFQPVQPVAEPVIRPVHVEAAPAVAREPVMAAPVESKPEPEPAEPEFDAPEEDDFSIASVADHLSADDVRVAISVSPAGDEGSVNAVALARLVAEEGRKIVLIDLTGSACPTRLMTETADLAGITNLLAGEVPFTETIHADRLSDAHIIPQGDADPVLAMRGIERLQMIIDALANAYDTVLIECGPADAGAISRVTRARDTKIIISAPSVANEEIIELITGFGEAGFGEIVLMTGTGYPQPGNSGRRAA